MKILFIANGYPPRRWAGTETYTAGLAKELQRRGHFVQVLCAGEWDKGPAYLNGAEDDLHDGIQVRRLNLNWQKAPDVFRYLYDDPVVEQYLVNLLTLDRPDLVHVTSCETLSASVLRAAKRTGLPAVLSLTDFWFLCPRMTLLHGDGALCDGQTTPWQCLRCMLYSGKAYRWPKRLLPDRLLGPILLEISRHSSLTRQRGLRGMAGDMANRKALLREMLQWPEVRTTASAFVRDIFQANGVSSPIRVQPYGHDLAWLHDYPGNTPSSRIRFGYIGQIASLKGAHLLVEAVRHLEALFPGRFTLSVYGNLQADEQYGERLRALAAGSESVRFRGTYAHERTGEVFTNLDVLVVPSTWYDFPLIIHEAFAAEVPVIATKLGGMAEVVTHEVNGLLFERGNVADLTRQLARMVAEPQTVDRLRAGIQPVRTVADEVTELEAIYEHTCRKGAARGRDVKEVLA